MPATSGASVRNRHHLTRRCRSARAIIGLSATGTGYRRTSLARDAVSAAPACSPGAYVATIIPFLQENNAFDPGDVAAMRRSWTTSAPRSSCWKAIRRARSSLNASKLWRGVANETPRTCGTGCSGVGFGQWQRRRRWQRRDGRAGALTGEPASVLVAEGRVARQRQQVALLEARGKDATEARSVLSAMVYSLRVLRRQQRRDRERPRN